MPLHQKVLAAMRTIDDIESWATVSHTEITESIGSIPGHVHEALLNLRSEGQSSAALSVVATRKFDYEVAGSSTISGGGACRLVVDG